MGKYVPSTSEEQQEMLKAVGVSSFDELYTVVPSGMKVDRLAIPEGKSELEVSGIVRAMAAKNKVYSSIFRGAGAYNHYIPSIVKSITENIMKYAENPLLLVVSNPADIITKAVQETSGLPANRVIGTGTSLDTARFRYNISTKLHVNVEDIQAYVVGEHGDSQVAVWSSAMVGGFPLEDYAKQVGVTLDKKEIAEHTKNGGAEVIGLKGATFYGIAMSVSNIVEAIMKDDSAILPAACVLDESFGEWAGVAVSLPCRIGWEGIETCLRIPMNEEEQAAMNKSVAILKDFWAQVKEQ